MRHRRAVRSLTPRKRPAAAWVKPKRSIAVRYCASQPLERRSISRKNERSEIDLVVGRAIERSHRGPRLSARTGVRRIGEHHECRRSIALPGLLEDLLPLLVGGAENLRGELAHVAEHKSRVSELVRDQNDTNGKRHQNCRGNQHDGSDNDGSDNGEAVHGRIVGTSFASTMTCVTPVMRRPSVIYITKSVSLRRHNIAP